MTISFINDVYKYTLPDPKKFMKETIDSIKKEQDVKILIEGEERFINHQVYADIQRLGSIKVFGEEVKVESYTSTEDLKSKYFSAFKKKLEDDFNLTHHALMCITQATSGDLCTKVLSEIESISSDGKHSVEINKIDDFFKMSRFECYSNRDADEYVSCRYYTRISVTINKEDLRKGDFEADSVKVEETVIRKERFYSLAAFIGRITPGVLLAIPTLVVVPCLVSKRPVEMFMELFQREKQEWNISPAFDAF